MAAAPDDTLSKLELILSLVESGAPSSGELAQAFEQVLAAVAQVKKLADSGDAQVRRDLTSDLRVLEAGLRGARKESKTGLAALRRIVDGLERWREREATKPPNAAITEALDLARENADLISALMLKGGKPGKAGKMPDHEWDGTRIRFELPDGSWGDWVDLRGTGNTVVVEGPGAGMGGVRRIRAGSGVTISGDPGEPTITATSSGSSLTVEEPSGTVDDSNLDFVFTAKPFLIVVNGLTFRENHGWSWTALTDTASLGNVVGTGGDIYGLMQL